MRILSEVKVALCVCVSISVCLHRSVGPYILQRYWYTHEAQQMKGQRVALPSIAAAPGKGRSPLRAAGSPGALLSLTAQESPGLLTDLQARLVLNLSSEVWCRKCALSSFNHAAQAFHIEAKSALHNGDVWRRPPQCNILISVQRLNTNLPFSSTILAFTFSFLPIVRITCDTKSLLV